MVFLVLCAKAQDKASKDIKGKRSEDGIRKKNKKVLPRDAWRGLARTPQPTESSEQGNSRKEPFHT